MIKLKYRIGELRTLIELSTEDRKYLYSLPLLKDGQVLFDKNNSCQSVLIAKELAEIYYFPDKDNENMRVLYVKQTIEGNRYRSFYTKFIRDKYLTPIWVSIVTTLLTLLLKYLLQGIL